jgi:predicted MFS family arabinose efflux permease
LIVFLMIGAVLPGDREAARTEAHRPERRFEGTRRLLTSKDRVAAIASAFFVSAGFMGFFLYIGTWLTTSFGLVTTQVSLIFVVAGVAALVGGLAAGPVADRFGKQRLALLSSIVMAPALLLIPAIGWGTLLFGSFLVAALAFAFRQGPLQALATELVPRSLRGLLVASRNTASQIGIAIATALCGLLYDSYGYGAVGIFSAMMTLAAAACIIWMREPVSRAESEEAPQAAGDSNH